MIVLAVLKDANGRLEVNVPASIYPPHEPTPEDLRISLGSNVGLPGEQKVYSVVLIMGWAEFKRYEHGQVENVFSEEHVEAGKALKQQWMISPDQQETIFAYLSGDLSEEMIQVMRKFDRHEQLWACFDRWLAEILQIGIQLGLHESANKKEI